MSTNELKKNIYHTIDRVGFIYQMIDRVKNELTPRKLDGKYIAYKVQPIVDDELQGKPFDEVKDILLTAHSLNVLHLVNAIARVLVYADEKQAQQIVQGQSKAFPLDLHIYLKKLLFSNAEVMVFGS